MSQNQYERVRTCNSVWYLALPWMGKFLEKLPTRKYVMKLIREYCKDDGISRRAMGLVTGARSSMFSDGEWKSVSYDNVIELARYGTDILFIEKADIAEVLAPFADKYGVAVVNTIGYLTEYGQDLMVAARKSGAHIAILTDYEDYGLNIVASVYREGIRIPRIGIDERVFHYFGLVRDTLAVDSQQYLKDYSFLNYFDHLDKSFLKTKRVEIDAILNEVGNERFWEYIMERMIELAPTRNYNRVISMPAVETLYSLELQELLTFMNLYHSTITTDKMTEIMKTLYDVKGMIDVEEKEHEIQDQLQDVVSNDAGVKDMNPILKKLLDNLEQKLKEREDKEKK
ncbi:hypothetical protein [Nitrososphaera sp. AFS]|uniref:hypothetical protein n=1 Tax=Nitrososphaera sp. AFS TaxID=2301191 RepID=UPI0013921F3A|nr:hypothetical protein [Nitrososphaera sp. AFS]